MKQFLKMLYSSQLMMILLFVFTVAIAIATFIENSYDITTAKAMIYNAKWFEVVMILMIINFIGNINKYNLLTIKKASGFIMHAAFIVIIIGAGITRYTGFEGNMHIREGEASNVIYSDVPYLQIRAEDNLNEYGYDMPLQMSTVLDNSFDATIKTTEKGNITISYKEYIKNAEEVLKENVEDGVDMLEITLMSGDGNNNTLLLKDGTTHKIGGAVFTFNNTDQGDINITYKNGKLNFISAHDISRSIMPEMLTDTILKGSTTESNLKEVYNMAGLPFAFSKVYQKAKKTLVSKGTEGRGINALLLDVEFDGKTNEVTVYGGDGYVSKFQDINIEGIKLSMAYGDKPIELPFSIHLKDFQLDRYAGSMSPSSYASEVILIDNRINLKEDYRIFMNNILDHDGYRFFQSSYDQDELGTILSVNHDFWGTWVSYFGYFLMGLGFIMTLISKNSRFIFLRKSIKDIRLQRKSTLLTLAFIVGLSGFAYSQDDHSNTSNETEASSLSEVIETLSLEHAEKFGQLITQSYDGRFEPIHTQAYSVLHKLSRKHKFNTEKGEMEGVQVFMDIFLNVEFWKKQKIIYVREKSVLDVLGIEGKYASYDDFFTTEEHNQNHESGAEDVHTHQVYKLQKFAETAFRKKQAEQNKFDKEIIKVDERVNIFMMLYQGTLFKIFPAQGSSNNKWVSWDENPASIPLSGPVNIINNDLQLASFTYSNIMRLYFTEVYNATKTGDYSRAEKILEHINSLQRGSESSYLLPTKKMVDFEISYNNSQIFITLKNWYSLLCVILLLLAFIDNLRTKKSKILGYILNFFIFLLGLGFMYHTYGMCVRWYLTGHAPWSNGYEALLLISWGSLLAGFCFIRNSKITLAATSLLAFLMLMTASHSSYDPQLTNLQPVLKSYWLIIHVAVITISYGFLGLGFILGIMNLIIMLFKTTKNSKRLELLTTELTYINEISLVIGLVLLTCGTFLGGIWANESWGRYWGWDAKETWSLVMVVTYTMILHLRLVPKLKGKYIFNIGAIIGFGTLCMTFIGVNYYLSKGLHSYGAGDTPVFPMWAWGLIISIIALIVAAGVKGKLLKQKMEHIDSEE
jgi:cytochrome c-type biogenesis protein CcsB